MQFVIMPQYATSYERRTGSNLRTIICDRDRLEDSSAPAWAEAFAVHGTLVEVGLRMPQNGCIRMAGSVALAEGLGAKNAALEVLDLRDNTFSQPGIFRRVVKYRRSSTHWPKDGTAYYSGRCNFRITTLMTTWFPCFPERWEPISTSRWLRGSNSRKKKAKWRL
jgi:hypothetical protein